MKSSKQELACTAACAVGLYVTWRVANWVAWRQEGLNRDATVGSADCDDCELTVLLDQVGFVLICFAACQRTAGLPCGRTVDLPAGGHVISLSAVN